MGFKRFFKDLVKGNYRFGKTASDRMTDNMPPGKARKVGAAIDVVAGLGLTYIFGEATLGCIAAAGLAVASAITSPVTIPAAIAVVAASALFGGLSALGTVIGVGFLKAAKDKLHIPGPKAVAAGIGHAAEHTAQMIAAPFKKTAQKLHQIFKRAHDGNGKRRKTGQPKPNAAPQRLSA